MDKKYAGLFVVTLAILSTACSISTQLQSGAHFESAECAGDYKAAIRDWASWQLETERHVILPDCEVHFGRDEVVVRIRSKPELGDRVDERIVRLERRGENAWYIIAANDMVWRVPDNQLLSEAPLEQVIEMREKMARRNVVYRNGEELAFYVKSLGPVRTNARNAYVMSMLTLRAERTAP